MAYINNNGQIRVGVRPTTVSVPSIITNGLILNLDAGNVSSYSGTGTTWTDLSGNNLNASLVNGVTYRTSDGGYFQFDGINDAIVLPYNSKLEVGSSYRDSPFSINSWVKFNGVNGGTFMNKGDNGNASYETYTVTIQPTGLSITLYNNSSIYVTIKTTGITLSAGTWYNITTSYTGGYGTPVYQPNYNGTMKLYINGTEYATTVTITGSYIKMDPYAGSTFIGSFGQVGAPGSYWAGSFNGSVAQTLMYNRPLSSSEVLQNYNATKDRFISNSLSDSDARAFVAAADITNITQMNAINTLVTSLKSAGIWTKMKAIYPFVGGNATSHKFNLKDPRDLDAAYRLTFSGGMTHSSTGVLFGGANGYADTKFIISQAYASSLSNIHVSFYSRNNTANGIMIGMQDDAVGQGSQIYLDDTGSTQLYSALNTDNNWVRTNIQSPSTGHYIVSRTSMNLLKGYKNGSIVGTNTTQSFSSNLKSNLPIILGSQIYRYSSTTYYYGNKEMAFATIGDGLTDTEATSLYNAVQTFQTTLGRQV